MQDCVPPASPLWLYPAVLGVVKAIEVAQQAHRR
jgi:hypothetical protein